MDFKDSAEQTAFRSEVHSWLEQNAEPKKEAGESLFGRQSSTEADFVKRAQDWQKKIDQVTWAYWYRHQTFLWQRHPDRLSR